MCVTTDYCPDCGGELIDTEDAAEVFEQQANESLRAEPTDPEGTAEYCRVVASSLQSADYWCTSCDRTHDEMDFCWGVCGEQVSLGDFE